MATYDCMAVTLMLDGKTVLTPHTALVEAGETVLEFMNRLLPAMPRVSLDDGTRIDAFSTKPADKNVPRCKFGHLNAGIRMQINAVQTTHVEFELHSPEPSTRHATINASGVDAAATMMQNARAEAKSTLPHNIEFKSGAINGANPDKLHQCVMRLLRDLGVTFKPSEQQAGKAFVQELSGLLWDMDKCATMRKLSGKDHKLPACLKKCANYATGSDGRVTTAVKHGTSHKKKVSVDAVIKREKVDEWVNTLHSMIARPCLDHQVLRIPPWSCRL